MAHPGMIQRQGKAWRVALRVEGRQYWFGPRKEPELRGATRKQVEEWAWRKYKELQKEAERKRDKLPVGWTMSNLLDEYEREVIPTKAPNTRRTYERGLQRFRSYFVEQLDDPRVERVRKAHVINYLSWRRRESKIGPRTEAKDRAELHAIFAYAVTLELREDNPVAAVKKPDGDARQPIILTPAQYEKLLHECRHDPMLRMYVTLLGETGARCESEALWLRWEDLHTDDGFIEFVSGRDGRRTKSGKSRWVPMTPALRQALAEHALRFRAANYEGKTSPWVFHHVRDRRHAQAGQRVATMRGAFKNAAKRAKLPADLHQHDLRHRRVTTWLAEGRDLMLVKEAMGHSTVKVTEGYTHLAREHLRRLVDEPAKVKAMTSA